MSASRIQAKTTVPIGLGNRNSNMPRSAESRMAYKTTVLVDDLNGKVHVAYGSLPNMVYIIEKSGKIVFKAMWTDHNEIESVLANLVLADRLRDQGIRVKASFTERIN